jgi:hypothetical protein
MKRTFVAFALAVFLAAPAFADLTMKQSTTGKGMGMSGSTAVTVYIKGHKMRSDTVAGDKTLTTVMDIDAQKMYIFDSKKKEADVYDMADLSADIAKTVDTSNMKVSLKPTGQTKQVAGQNAAGYDLTVEVPAAMGGNKEMMMTITLQGPVWIVKNAPGTADFIGFYKAAAEKGWIFGDPRAAKAQPGQARAMSAMFDELAKAGGIPYEQEMQIKMSAAGGAGNPMSGLFAKMGNVSFSSTTDSVQAGPLADDLFAPPAGYKVNTKK